MNLLLDTHVFLWYITDDGLLPSAARSVIRDKRNTAYLSVVSSWEMLIKHQIGKLPLPAPVGEYLRSHRERHQIASLPLSESSLDPLLHLPLHHRDPFDRMLIAQAKHHDLVIVTADAQFALYPIRLLAT